MPVEDIHLGVAQGVDHLNDSNTEDNMKMLICDGDTNLLEGWHGDEVPGGVEADAAVGELGPVLDCHVVRHYVPATHLQYSRVQYSTVQ